MQKKTNMDSQSQEHDRESPVSRYKAYLTKMDTLIEGIEYLRTNGFPLDFLVDKNGLYERGSDERFTADQIRIIVHKRFEGKSDPMDMSVLYGLEIPGNRRGTLVNSYGPYADALISDFIQDIPKSENSGSGPGNTVKQKETSSGGAAFKNVVQHALISTGMFSGLLLASGIHSLFNR